MCVFCMFVCVTVHVTCGACLVRSGWSLCVDVFTYEHATSSRLVALVDTGDLKCTRPLFIHKHALYEQRTSDVQVCTYECASVLNGILGSRHEPMEEAIACACVKW